jgi:hypothetical protein
MVKAIIRLGLLLAFLLSLSACVLYLSAFPVTLSQVLVKKDLTGVIPAGYGSNYRPFVVTAGGQDFVILTNSNFAVDPIVVILDKTLNLIQTYTLSWLQGWAPSFNGTAVLADAAGNVEIGNVAFSPNELATVGVNPSWISNPTVFGASFSSPDGQKNDINFSVDSSNNLTYSQYQWWTTLEFNTPIPLGGPAGVQFRAVGAFNVDDTYTAGKVVLVLGDQSGPTCYFVSIPLSAFYTSTVQTSVLNAYPNQSVPNLDSGSIGFAGSCFVAYSYDTQTLNRYDLSFNLIDKTPFDHPKNGQLLFSYKQSGEFFVTYDPSTLRLTKYADWWN